MVAYCVSFISGSSVQFVRPRASALRFSFSSSARLAPRVISHVSCGGETQPPSETRLMLVGAAQAGSAFLFSTRMIGFLLEY
jgi:hypothetical protein